MHIGVGTEPASMEVRPHLSQHETAEELPLVSASATVTEVTAMDRNRNDEVLRAIGRTLDASGSVAWERVRPEGRAACHRWIRKQLDPIDRGTPLNRYLDERDQRGRVGHQLRALQERYLRPYPSLVRVTVETGKPVEFVAGQYFSLRYRGRTRPYSVACSPTESALEFCLRRVPGGRLTSTVAESLSPGDTVSLRGPYGDLAMEHPSERDVVFLATGTGVAPFRSMLDYCIDRGWDVHACEPRDVWLFLGAPWEDDLPYRQHFGSLARTHDNVHFVPTLSRERYLTDWTGETAYVQHVFVKYLREAALAGVDLPRAFERARAERPRTSIRERIDPGSVEVYACGVNAMVHALVDAAVRVGVPACHTQFEGYG